MRNISFNWLFASIFIVLITCCKNDKQANTEKNLADSIHVDFDSESLSIKYNNFVYSLPSPHHAAILIKNINIHFNVDYINEVENAMNYVSNTKKALNLGVYGTDLGYINIYEHNQKSLEYFGVIQKLSNELKVSSAIDVNTYKLMQKNLNNSDSLIYYLSASYNEIHAYLKNNDQEYTGALIVTGGWIESLYIVSRYYLDKDDQVLFSFLGAQKYPLENLIRILEPFYGENEEFSVLFDDLVNLAYIFDNIDFKNKIIEKNTYKDQNLTIIKNQSEMECFDEILVEIAKKIAAIRKKIVV